MKKKIYITDDDHEIQDILKIIFETAGYKTTAYYNGKELLENTHEYPDIYILDNQLPEMDGLNICRRLKNDDKTKGIPVIMVSATPGVGVLARKAGADDFIEKPFRKVDLLDMVARQINIKASKRTEC